MLRCFTPREISMKDEEIFNAWKTLKMIHVCRPGREPKDAWLRPTPVVVQSGSVRNLTLGPDDDVRRQLIKPLQRAVQLALDILPPLKLRANAGKCIAKLDRQNCGRRPFHAGILHLHAETVNAFTLLEVLSS
jgi:hypothetical protein